MLKILPGHIANLIAAGEVVQRPASVVKELLENAVDAEATNVLLIVNDSGRTLIQVIDNGKGMNAEEAELCFSRHATSKIESAEDLYNINTFGFRGEALASIAACADVTLKTRKAGEETGTEVHIAENRIISTAQTSAPQGSNFAVRNIFYNIPARRKFLKSDNVEYKQIVSEFIKVALTRTDIEFRFVHNSKDIYHLPAVGNIKQRITQISGKESAKDLIDLQTDTTVVGIRGFVGRPSLAKKNQPNQYFFVNGRFFKSPLLHKAVMKAYSNLIQEGTTPSYYIYLQIEPGNMDINIHPSKTEIKFENEGVMFDILNAAVKEAIGEGAFIPSIDFDTEGAPEIPSMSKEPRYVAPPKINFDPLFNPFDEELKIRRGGGRVKYNSNTEFAGGDFENPPFDLPDPQVVERGESIDVQYDEEGGVQRSYFQEQKGQDSVFNEQGGEDYQILQIKGRYILTPVNNGVMAVDIKGAKERILYERYLKSMVNTLPAIQENLYPKAIDLDHLSYVTLMENPDKLREVGFDIRSFGNDCIVVYGLPSIFADEEMDIESCIDNLIHILDEPGENLENRFKEKIALDMAKSRRTKGGESLTDIEAQYILNELFKCDEPYSAPSGGFCATVITMDELAGRF